MDLILLRHGQSKANKDKVIGTPEVSLTQLGRDQALKAGLRLKAKKIDRVLVSPYTRAQETAQEVNKSLGLSLETEDLVREVSFGILEGHRFEDMEKDPNYKDVLQAWLDNPRDTAPPGGESIRDARARAQAFLDKYKDQDQTILVVSHEGFIRALLSVVVGSVDSFFRFKVDNCSYIQAHWGDYPYIQADS
ncbi:MAG: histidine phosphatase family protein [Tissierellia bacterium]|nr:histidine phosphatase family protein [Tissierellia bacterium]